MKITPFELLCLWNDGKYPKRVLYNGKEFKLNTLRDDYIYIQSYPSVRVYLSSCLEDDLNLKDFLTKKRIEIFDVGEDSKPVAYYADGSVYLMSDE